ncbi:cuticle collagen dpy-5-like, partial [Malurus melanocephalus]|uniref:cuticle collagen dpy-5-like n=1 Tax=Malurus melanocephalus TaxID=175006 RepID=UPI0025493FFB
MKIKMKGEIMEGDEKQPRNELIPDPEGRWMPFPPFQSTFAQAWQKNESAKVPIPSAGLHWDHSVPDPGNPDPGNPGNPGNPGDPDPDPVRALRRSVSSSIDVPGRRSAAPLDVDEMVAALVLTSLSCSPAVRSPPWPDGDPWKDGDVSDGGSSTGSASSGHWSGGSATGSPKNCGVSATGSPKNCGVSTENYGVDPEN